jgi:serine/threonine-protein kinase RsbW
MDHGKRRVIEMVTGPDTLDEIQHCLDEFWSANSANSEVPEAVRMQVSIASAEVAANIIEHAGNGRSVLMRMELLLLHDEVQISFNDNGIAADIDLSSSHMPDVMAERGRGLALTQAVMASVAYRRGDGENTWTLVSERFS